MTFTIILGLAAYILGSIPFGLILSALAGHGDIRKIGSGNIGATNVLRTGNKALALATLLLDIGKGAGFILLLLSILPHVAMRPYLIFFGLLAILGHCFPVWLKFKGGKGVATTLGVLLAAVPVAGLAACAVWLITAFAFRISSLAAIAAMIAAPVVSGLVYGANAGAVNILIAALVIFKHKDNIKRLLKGEEPKIGKKNEA